MVVMEMKIMFTSLGHRNYFTVTGPIDDLILKPKYQQTNLIYYLPLTPFTSTQ